MTERQHLHFLGSFRSQKKLLDMEEWMNEYTIQITNFLKRKRGGRKAPNRVRRTSFVKYEYWIFILMEPFFIPSGSLSHLLKVTVTFFIRINTFFIRRHYLKLLTRFIGTSWWWSGHPASKKCNFYTRSMTLAWQLGIFIVSCWSNVDRKAKPF